MKILLAWSSGKDSAWSLHLLNQQYPGDVRAMLTTMNQTDARVAVHAVRDNLLQAQAVAAGLPLWRVPLPDPCTNEVYEARMREACARAVAEGFTHVAFGDLFLEDIRSYREKLLEGTGLAALFPVWQMPTRELAETMIASGLRALLSVVDTRVLDASFAGREFDAGLLADLPAGVDPCGENGEFHTCVYAGPMFRRPIEVEIVGRVDRPPFTFCDIKPCPTPAASSA